MPPEVALEFYAGHCPFCGYGFFGKVNSRGYQERRCGMCKARLFPAEKRAVSGMTPHGLPVELQPRKSR